MRFMTDLINVPARIKILFSFPNVYHYYHYHYYSYLFNEFLRKYPGYLRPKDTFKLKIKMIVLLFDFTHVA